MIKLITGKKGTGKTKILVEQIKAATENAESHIVCIEKSMQLTTEIPHKVRLIDADEYMIDNLDKFYGLIAGALASNYDLTHIYVDGIFKIGGRDYEKFGDILAKIEKISENCNIVFTVSADLEELPESVKKFAD